MENVNNGTQAVQENQGLVVSQNANDNVNQIANQIAEKEIQANLQANNLEFGEEIRKMLPTAGTLELTEEQKKCLYEPIKDNEVSIKPDGLIYLSWIKYSGRLTSAFTGTGWAMLPQGMPKVQNNLVIWGFHLIIKGVYSGFAIGEQQYFDNGRMSYGEACEGAKSNALMRLCKGIGIGLELWDKTFIDRWLAAYANKKWDDDKRKYMWSLKPNAFGTENTTIIQTPAPAKTQAPAPVSTTISPNSANTTIPKGKLKENTDFLNQAEKPATKKAKKSTDDIPIVPMSDSDIDGENDDTHKLAIEFVNLLKGSKTKDELSANYGQIRTAFANGQITEQQKEELRTLANNLHPKL